MRGIQPSLTHCVWGEPTLVCRGCSAPCAMRHLLQVIASECVRVCVFLCGLCASIKCHSQRCPQFLLHQSDAYSENARRRSRSRPGGTEQLGDGCQPGPWHHLCSETTQACSHTPASYQPLELFTPGSVCFSPTTTSAHLFGSKLLRRDAPAPVN